MRSPSSAPTAPAPGYATTMHLLGDRVICSFCGLADHAARFIGEDVALCEDCERAEAIAAAGGAP